MNVYNSAYPKGGGSCSKDSFVANGTLVFQIKSFGKNSALRVAANSYRAFGKWKPSQNNGKNYSQKLKLKTYIHFEWKT